MNFNTENLKNYYIKVVIKMKWLQITDMHHAILVKKKLFLFRNIHLKANIEAHVSKNENIRAKNYNTLQLHAVSYLAPLWCIPLILTWRGVFTLTNQFRFSVSLAKTIWIYLTLLCRAVNISGFIIQTTLIITL